MQLHSSPVTRLESWNGNKKDERQNSCFDRQGPAVEIALADMG